MKPYLNDPDFTLFQGNVWDVAPQIAIPTQCIVTSPPYYGLRDYDTGYWVDDPGDCNHAAARIRTRYDYTLDSSPKQDAARTGTDAVPGMWKKVCPTCGALRVDEQLGHEDTPLEYAYRLAAVFDLFIPTLTQDSTVFVNIGDCYADGELVGIPWMFALAMKEGGWRLINDVIWVKPNGMPESVKRRFSKYHEHIFVFARTPSYKFNQQLEKQNIDRYVTWVEKGDNSIQHRAGERWPNPEGRNMRDWWAIPTASYPGAHFAVMPNEIVRRCIAAGTDEGDVVLDPFMGSGTTARVARAMGRKTLGIELNEDYCKQIADNTRQLSLFAEEVHDGEA